LPRRAPALGRGLSACVRGRTVRGGCAAFSEMVAYFGEDIKTTTPGTFFGTFWDFFVALERASAENAQVQAKEKQAAQRAAQSEAMKKHARPAPPRRSPPMPVATIPGASRTPQAPPPQRAHTHTHNCKTLKHPVRGRGAGAAHRQAAQHDGRAHRDH
jgi:hypothetical protein